MSQKNHHYQRELLNNNQQRVELENTPKDERYCQESVIICDEVVCVTPTFFENIPDPNQQQNGNSMNNLLNSIDTNFNMAESLQLATAPILEKRIDENHNELSIDDKYQSNTLQMRSPLNISTESMLDMTTTSRPPANTILSDGDNTSGMDDLKQISRVSQLEVHTPNLLDNSTSNVSSQNTTILKAHSTNAIAESCDTNSNSIFNSLISVSNTKAPRFIPSGRRNRNLSDKDKRARNLASVKRCRQRKAHQYKALVKQASQLEAENRVLESMLHSKVSITPSQQQDLIQSIQMSKLIKLNDLLKSGMPKDLVHHADSLWEINAVLSANMPSRCYYGIESIRAYWKASLRMRNKGKIRSFWAWLFSLTPERRFSTFQINRIPSSQLVNEMRENGMQSTLNTFTGSSHTMPLPQNLYRISWATGTTPQLSGAMLLLFGLQHRIVLHVECYGLSVWRYLLSEDNLINETFIDSQEIV